MPPVPVYLINLDGSDDRLRSATAQLAAEGLAFERVPAFDGRALTRDQFPGYDHAAAMRYMGRPMRGGEIGCYLSHLDCARRFLATGAPVALVLEDDMKLLPGFAEALAQVLTHADRVRPGWEIVNLGAPGHKIFTPVHGFAVRGRRHALTLAHYFPMTTTGLVWSRDGARAFVADHGRIFAPVDNYFRHRFTRRDTGLAVWPPIVTTTGAESEISPDRGPRRSAQGRHLLYGLIKQRRLLTDKLIAIGSRRAARRRLASGP